ncbi:Ferredoxin--NADP reductase [Bienertia sinuspersici]
MVVCLAVFLACSLLTKVIEADAPIGKEKAVAAPDNANGWTSDIIAGPGDDENDETSETKYEGDGDDGPRTVVMGH